MEVAGNSLHPFRFVLFVNFAFSSLFSSSSLNFKIKFRLPLGPGGDFVLLKSLSERLNHHRFIFQLPQGARNAILCSASAVSVIPCGMFIIHCFFFTL